MHRPGMKQDEQYHVLFRLRLFVDLFESWRKWLDSRWVIVAPTLALHCLRFAPDRIRELIVVCCIIHANMYGVISLLFSYTYVLSSTQSFEHEDWPRRPPTFLFQRETIVPIVFLSFKCMTERFQVRPRTLKPCYLDAFLFSFCGRHIGLEALVLL